MVFPDLQGRLVGKRTTGRFFLEHVADAEGTENCDYLIACDMDNNPVPGYRFTSYEQGYGDMLAVADWSTDPHHAVGREDGDDHVRPVRRRHRRARSRCRPAQILRRQEEAAAALGFLPMVASEIEFYLFRDTYDEAHAKGYRDLTPHSPWLEDYHILQTTKDEYILGADPPRPRGRRRAGASSPRARPAAASTRSTSTTPPRSRWPTATASTRTRRRRSPRSTAASV